MDRVTWVRVRVIDGDRLNLDMLYACHKALWCMVEIFWVSYALGGKESFR